MSAPAGLAQRHSTASSWPEPIDRRRTSHRRPATCAPCGPTPRRRAPRRRRRRAGPRDALDGRVVAGERGDAAAGGVAGVRRVVVAAGEQQAAVRLARERRHPVVVRGARLRLRRREQLDVLERHRLLAAEREPRHRLAERAAEQLALQQEVERPRRRRAEQVVHHLRQPVPREPHRQLDRRLRHAERRLEACGEAHVGGGLVGLDGGHLSQF